MLAISLVVTHSLGQFNVLPDEVDVRDREDAPEPSQQAVNVGQEHRNYPEPHEDEELLGEEIDRQGTFDRVVLQVTELSDGEVAHGDGWEDPDTLTEVSTIDK